MSKKKESKLPAYNRYGSKTLNQLREFVSAVEKEVDRLKPLVDWIEENKLKSIHLDGITKDDRSLKLLKSFRANLQKAVIDKQIELED